MLDWNHGSILLAGRNGFCVCNRRGDEASVDSTHNVILEFPLLEASTQWFRSMLLKGAVTSSLMSLVSQGDRLNHLILLKSP